MALALTNSFKAGEQIVLSKWDTNFDEVEAELNAFPTAGAIGTGVVKEIDILQGAIDPTKISNNIQFEVLPKCLANQAASAFTNDDQLVNLAYTLSRLSAVFSDGDFTAGETLYDADTASTSEKVTLPNGRTLVFGYEKSATTASKSKDTDISGHSLSAIYTAFAIPVGDKATYGLNSELSCVITALTTNTMTVYQYIRSYASGVGMYGYFYFIIGK